MSNNIKSIGSKAALWSLKQKDREIPSYTTYKPKNSSEFFHVNQKFIGEELIKTSPYIAPFIKINLIDNYIPSWQIHQFSFFYKKLNVLIHISIGDPKKELDAIACKKILDTVIFGHDCIYKTLEQLNKKQTKKTTIKSSTPSNLSICLLLFDEKRQFPKPYETWRSDHINAGVTFSEHAHERYIFLYRKQHLHKVLLHELIHSYHLDFKVNDYTKQEQSIKERLGYNLTNTWKLLELNEAFTEVLACFWNLYLYKHYSQTRKSINSLWKEEYKHYKNVCKTIMIMSNPCPFVYKKQRHPLLKFNISESTHMFSYVFGKTMLWCLLDNIPILVNVSSNYKQMLKIIEKQIKNHNFWQDIYNSNTINSFTMTKFDI